MPSLIQRFSRLLSHKRAQTLREAAGAASRTRPARRDAAQEAEMEARPDTFVLTRIIGNDLVPRHAEGQSLANLRFILDHEPPLEACEKRFVVNRIFDDGRPRLRSWPSSGRAGRSSPSFPSTGTPSHEPATTMRPSRPASSSPAFETLTEEERQRARCGPMCRRTSA
jgi:hypothetical protein